MFIEATGDETGEEAGVELGDDAGLETGDEAGDDAGLESVEAVGELVADTGDAVGDGSELDPVQVTVLDTSLRSDKVNVIEVLLPADKEIHVVPPGCAAEKVASQSKLYDGAHLH